MKKSKIQNVDSETVESLRALYCVTVGGNKEKMNDFEKFVDLLEAFKKVENFKK